MEKWVLKKHQIYHKKFIQISINRFYRIALNRFYSKLKHHEIKRLTFFNYRYGQAPEYSDEFYQLYYYLKYFYSYSFLYQSIYMEVLKNIRSEKRFHVVSLGCGGLIDYYGLNFALSKSMISFDFTYVGVDKIGWKLVNIMKTPKPSIGDVIEIVNLNGYLTDGLNIIIFPYSFFEMQYSKICKVFINTNFKCKELFFVFTLRDTHLHEDKKMIENFFSELRTILSNKYTCKGIVDHFDLGDGKIDENDKDFKLDGNYKVAMSKESLFKRCRSYSKEDSVHCSDSCNENSIRSNIMLNKKYLHYSLMAFRRK